MPKMGQPLIQKHMHLDHSELTLLYNSTHPRDKQVVPYAMTICSKINKQDVSSMDISATLFEYLVNALNCDPNELINKADPEYQEKHRGHEYKPKMWFKAIKNNPNLLKAPIALYKNKAIVCLNPTDVLKLR